MSLLGLTGTALGLPLPGYPFTNVATLQSVQHWWQRKAPMGAKELIAQDGCTMATSKSLKTEDNYLLKYRCRKRPGRTYIYPLCSLVCCELLELLKDYLIERGYVVLINFSCVNEVLFSQPGSAIVYLYISNCMIVSVYV